MPQADNDKQMLRPRYLDQAIAPYAKDPSKYSSYWRKLTTVQVWQPILHLFPKPPCRLIDIAAGDGRDAQFFNSLGYDVTAVEPSSALRNLALTLSTHNSQIHWMDESFPYLATIPHSAFKLATVSTGFVHVPQEDQRSSLQSLYNIIEKGGRVAISLREGLLDPERLMFATNMHDFIDWAKELGFTVLKTVTTEDLRGRSGVCYQYLLLEKE